MIDGLLSLFASFGQYFEAIGALAGEEAREAGELCLRLAALLAAAVFFAAFGYVLLLFFSAFLIAAVFHVSWMWILLGFTAIHFLAAVVCAVQVKIHWRTPVFPATKSEISRDLEALKGARNP